MSLRVVWDEATGRDVAYVMPSGDDDAGNKHAALIAAAQELREALELVLNLGSDDETAVVVARKALSDAAPWSASAEAAYLNAIVAVRERRRQRQADKSKAKPPEEFAPRNF